MKFFNNITHKINKINTITFYKKYYLILSKDLVTKTFLIGQPYMEYSYNLRKPAAKHNNGDYCFHLIGVDVMLDADDNPWLIEVRQPFIHRVTNPILDDGR